MLTEAGTNRKLTPPNTFLTGSYTVSGERALRSPATLGCGTEQLAPGFPVHIPSGSISAGEQTASDVYTAMRTCIHVCAYIRACAPVECVIYACGHVPVYGHAQIPVRIHTCIRVLWA